MTELEVKAEPQTAPVLETAPAQSEAAETPQETSLTREDVKALIQETWAERKVEIDKELDTAYKTLRRGEAKSDTAQKRIDKLETELFDLSVRGADPQAIEIEKLKRQVQRDADSRTAPDANAEVAAFNAWSKSFLEEEGIASNDPVLAEAFKRYGDGWQTQADLKVALTRAIARVRTEEAKKAKSDSAEAVKKAREEQDAKHRNETRQSEGKVDKGTPASAAKRNFLTMTSEELAAFNASRRR